MSGFQDAVREDNRRVFLNLEEYGERRTVELDGQIYRSIPVVLSGLQERSRRQLISDHAQGLYLVSRVLHAALRDLGGVQPEKGQRIRIDDRDGYTREYYIVESVCEMGMVRLDMEAVDE